jgi:hypothetical protein
MTAPLIIGYDLAEKFSGIVVLNTSGAVVLELAVQGTHASDVHREFMKAREVIAGEPAHFFVEDVFVGAALSSSYKGAVIHQGRLDMLMFLGWKHEPFPSVTYVRPTIWQQKLGCPKMISAKKRAELRKQGISYPTTKSWAKEKCEQLGYEPPGWSRGSKALEDMRDAALIAVYGYQEVYKTPLTKLVRPA